MFPLIAGLLAAAGSLLGFAVGAAYGGRHAAAQSNRADTEKERADTADRRAEAAERAASLAAMAAGESRRQLAEYVNARVTRAGRKVAGR